MADYGPHVYTQTLKWMDGNGNAKGRWHRLDGINNSPFTAFDAGDGDGLQSWEFQEFNCPGLDSGLVSGSVTITCAHSPAVKSLVFQAAANQWLIEVTQFEVTLAGLSRISSGLFQVSGGGGGGEGGGLTSISFSATSTPPPVMATMPPRIATTELIGTPCVLSF